MCIVIDTNCFSLVFNRNNAAHSQFAAVLVWIVDGHGKAVYGGTKYLSELRTAIRYQRIFVELKKAGKAIEIEKKSVDEHQARVERTFNPANYNDSHLAAIVSACGCRLVCTKDDRAIRLLKDARCYPTGIARPKIYKRAEHASLLCDENIADVCRPVVMLSKSEREAISSRGSDS